ncbi:MAG: hypothetical protein J5I65_03760 [Aridibacter famidurans]|nr:hypothetical protein [Aridibacter famidurans]
MKNSNCILVFAIICVLAPAAYALGLDCDVPFQTGHTNDILDVTFSPDDSQLLSYSAADGRLILWEVATRKKLWTVNTAFIRKANERTNLEQFNWSADGKSVVTKSVNGSFQVWDIKTGEARSVSDSPPEIELVFPKSRSITYERDYSGIKITDPDTSEVTELDQFGNNSAFGFSNDGMMIAEGAGWGRAAIKVTKWKTGESWFLEAHPGQVSKIAFSPDGNLLAVGGSDQFIYVYEADSLKCLSRFERKDEDLYFVAFGRDQSKLLVAYEDGVLEVWNWQSKKSIKSATILKGVSGFSIPQFSENGAYCYFLVEANLAVYDTTDWKRLGIIRTKEGYRTGGQHMSIEYGSVPINSATFSVSGEEIVTSHYDGSLRVWETRTGKQLRSFPFGKEAAFLLPLNLQKVIAVVGKRDDSAIEIIDFRSGSTAGRIEHEDLTYIEGFAISSDKRVLATSDISGLILVWDVASRKHLFSLNFGFSGDDALAFSPDGKYLAAGGRNQNVFLFNTENGKRIRQLLPDYVPSDLETVLRAKGNEARRGISEQKWNWEKKASEEVPALAEKVSVEFSHYGKAESFWDKRIAETGKPDQSKLVLPKNEAEVVWFKLTNNSSLPIVIDTNSMYLNPTCKGLCEGAEISSRYLMEMENGDIQVNGFDMYSRSLLAPGTSVVFDVSFRHIEESRRIFLTFTFQKERPFDDEERDYGPTQKVYVRLDDLPK